MENTYTNSIFLCLPDLNIEVDSGKTKILLFYVPEIIKLLEN